MASENFFIRNSIFVHISKKWRKRLLVALGIYILFLLGFIAFQKLRPVAPEYTGAELSWPEHGVLVRFPSWLQDSNATKYEAKLIGESSPSRCTAIPRSGGGAASCLLRATDYQLVEIKVRSGNGVGWTRWKSVTRDVEWPMPGNRGVAYCMRVFGSWFGSGPIPGFSDSEYEMQLWGQSMLNQGLFDIAGGSFATFLVQAKAEWIAAYYSTGRTQPPDPDAVVAACENAGAANGAFAYAPLAP